MSSAYRLINIFVSRPGTSKPVRSGEFCIDAASGSMARSKRRHERGSPCLIPRVTR